MSKTTAIPLASPPGPVGFIVLELAGQEDCNKNLLDGPLDCDDGDDAEDGMGSIPEFQEPLIPPISTRAHDKSDFVDSRRTQKMQ